jgi:Flp pilus assembly protein TadD
MSERTQPDARIPHEVQTRLADVREFRDELVAAAKQAIPQNPDEYLDVGAQELLEEPAPLRRPERTPSQDELDAQLTNLLGVIAEDEIPTAHVKLPAHGYDEHVATRMRQIPDASSLSAWDAPSLTNMLDLALGTPVAPEDAHVPKRRRREPHPPAPPRSYASLLDEPITPESFDGKPEQSVVVEDSVYVGGDHTPVPIGPVHTPVPPTGERPREPSRTHPVHDGKPRSRMSATAFMVVCAVGAANVGLMAGLYLHDDAESVTQTIDAPAPAAAPTPAAPAAAPAATPPATVDNAEAPEPPAEPAEDPLQTARVAIDGADADSADEALTDARRTGADPAFLERLNAELLVLRGDGAAAVPDLRAMTEAYSDDAMLWAALGRALAQAERDSEAERAFQRALELDEHAIDALVGLARLKTRAANIRAARAHLRDARQAYDAGEPNATAEARLFVTEGGIDFELGDFDEATAHAQRALTLDGRSAEAYLLLARIALERRDDSATDHLRAAAAGRAPPAEALGLLIPRLSGDEACTLADRYLVIAPHGYDLRDVRRVQQRCR